MGYEKMINVGVAKGAEWWGDWLIIYNVKIGKIETTETNKG